MIGQKYIFIGLLSLVGIILCSYYFLVEKETQVVIHDDASALRQEVVFWKERIRELGPEKSYAEFLEVAHTKQLSTHDQAHAFGEALYDIKGLEGLSYCDPSFEFGCYHSFFGVAVQEKGEAVLSDFSEACKDRFGDYNLPCEHGIGHGVLVYTDYENLIRALELCESISEVPTGGCSSGVFMENNFHTMDETVEESYSRPFDENNLYAPCNTLPLRFQESCYLEQVQWWQGYFSSDFVPIGDLCTGLKDSSIQNYEACFYGIGNYLAASVQLDIDRSYAGCTELHDKEGARLCVEGASWLIKGDGSSRDKATMLCNMLTDDTAAATCTSKL